MTVPQKRKIGERKVGERKLGFWLPVLACLLLAGTVWLGFRQYEAQQRDNQLFLALQAADPRAVRVALDSGANPNSVIAAGSASGGFSSTLQQWFDQILHRNLTSTALTVAVSSQNSQCVRLLLDRGADPNRPNSDGGTPLTRAARIQNFGPPQYMQALTQKQIQIMQMLLDKGANINAQDQSRRTALSNSVMNSYNGAVDLTVPRFLLMHGANVNVKGESGETLFQDAVQSGDNSTVPFVSLLLDHGADVNKTDSFGGTPLQRASEWINPALVQVLLNHGANPNVHSPANDMTPLIQSARQGQLATMKLLLSKGADVNAFSKYDSTALFVAAQHKRADMIKLLLDHGANPNYINQFEMCTTALVVASGSGDLQSVKLLLAHGADVNLEGSQDETPLTAAASECLLFDYAKRHKNIGNLGDVAGLLPVSPPCRIDVAQTLLAAGADPNKVDHSGNAALVYAVAGHNLPLVRLLMAHGANPNAYGGNSYVPESAKESPLSLAKERGYSDLLPLLQGTHP